MLSLSAYLNAKDNNISFQCNNGTSSGIVRVLFHSSDAEIMGLIASAATTGSCEVNNSGMGTSSQKSDNNITSECHCEVDLNISVTSRENNSSKGEYDNAQNHDPHIGLFSFGLFFLVCCVICIILVNIKWAKICHEVTMTKKFVTLDNQITDGKDKETIRFKGSAKDEPIEIEVQESTLSTSKVVALLGAIAIFILFIGFGTFAVAKYYYTGVIPSGEISKMIHFLLGGLILFVPYIINKIFDTGRNLTKKK